MKITLLQFPSKLGICLLMGELAMCAERNAL